MNKNCIKCNKGFIKKSTVSKKKWLTMKYRKTPTYGVGSLTKLIASAQEV